MFRLHDSTRRQICTAAFALLCLFPTLCVGAWAIVWRLPWDRQAEEARLSANMGVAVTIQSVEHTLPGVVRYKGLKITDAETGMDLLYCRELEAGWTSMTDSHQECRPAINLAARGVESTATAWPRLKEVLRRSLECQNGLPEVELRTTADAWIVHEGATSQLLENVWGGIGVSREPTGCQAQLAFRLAQDASRPLVRMRLVRDRRAAPPAYRYDVETESGSLPDSVAALIQALERTDPTQIFSREPSGVWAQKPGTGSTIK